MKDKSKEDLSFDLAFEKEKNRHLKKEINNLKKTILNLKKNDKKNK